MEKFTKQDYRIMKLVDKYTSFNIKEIVEQGYFKDFKNRLIIEVKEVIDINIIKSLKEAARLHKDRKTNKLEYILAYK